jgi:uncharacterized membrane protein
MNKILLSPKFWVPVILAPIVDLIWINIVMWKDYKLMIKKIQGTVVKPNLYYALAAYICVAILLYVIIKNDLTLFEAFLIGACSWGVYDFTAGTFFKDWDLPLALLDVIWGGILLMSMKYVSDIMNK